MTRDEVAIGSAIIIPLLAEMTDIGHRIKRLNEERAFYETAPDNEAELADIDRMLRAQRYSATAVIHAARRIFDVCVNKDAMTREDADEAIRELYNAFLAARA